MTDSIEEIMKGAETMRQKQGYCPFQRTIDDEIRYCNYLVEAMENPHTHYRYLSKERVLVQERDDAGNLVVGVYYKSDFVPTKNTSTE